MTLDVRAPVERKLTVLKTVPGVWPFALGKSRGPRVLPCLALPCLALVGKLKVEKGVKLPSRALIRLSRLAALKGHRTPVEGETLGIHPEKLTRVLKERRLFSASRRSMPAHPMRCFFRIPIHWIDGMATLGAVSAV